MKLLITGGTGFIGRSLSECLLGKGHQLILLTRNPKKISAQYIGRNVEVIDTIEALNSEMEIDAIINLAGEGIADKRWSAQRKQELIVSRESVTQAVIEYIKRAKKKPGVLINGSAVGFYGEQGDIEVLETSPCNPDFGHRICEAWEYIAKKARESGVRVCIIRLGPVVGSGGGFLQRMLLPFKLGLGGRIGDGQQWMSWVHIDDVIGVIDFLLHKLDAEGAYNLTAPTPVRNSAFAQIFAGVLHRPAIFPLPASLLKMALGEMSELLLGGQKVLPARLQASGYQFKYPELKEALEQVFKK